MTTQERNQTQDNNEKEDPLERLALLIENENGVSEEFKTLMQSTPKHEVSWIVSIETFIFHQLFSSDVNKDSSQEHLLSITICNKT